MSLDKADWNLIFWGSIALSCAVSGLLADMGHREPLVWVIGNSAGFITGWCAARRRS